MRVLAGAVVVFTGGLVFVGSMLAGALESSHGRTPSGEYGWGVVLSVLLLASGVFMIIRAWPGDGRALPPPTAGPPTGEEGGSGRRT